MAYPLFTQSGENTASLTCVVALPPHVAGQHILVFAAQDNGSGSITASGSWTSVVTQGASGGVRGAVFRLEATSSAETLTLTSGVSAAWVYVAVVCPNVLSATPVDGWQRTDWNNVATAATSSVAASSNSGSAITASEAGCLALVMWCSDNGTSTSGPFLRSPFNNMIELGRRAENGVMMILGYRQLESSGAIPTFNMQHTLATEGGNGIVVLLRNSSGGSRAPDCRTGETSFRYYGQFGNQDATTTWITPNDTGTPANGITGGAQIDGLDVNATAGSHVTNSLLMPWGFASTLNLTQNTAGSWCGAMHTCSATDMSGKVFSIEHAVGVISAVRFGDKGNIVVFKDGSGNWVAYTLARRVAYEAANVTYVSHIALGEADALASSGTMDWTNVVAFAVLQHRVGSSAGTNNVHFRNAFLWGTSKIVQGGAARPASYGILPRAFNQWGAAKLSDLQGASQIIAKAKIQIGETTETTYFDSSGSSMEFPAEYQESPVDPLTSQVFWNVNANAAGAGLSLKPSASDTINLTAGVSRTSVQLPFTVDASASTSAAVSTQGESIIGWAPTLKTGVPITGATFKDCGEIDAKGATLTGCTISDTTSTDAAIAFSESGGAMDGCTVDVTGTDADYHLEVGNGGAGDFSITLTDQTFTGTPGVDKVHATNTAGTTTITIAGTTSLVAGDVTSAGATVVIAAPQPTLDATVLSGSRVVLYNDTTDAELDNTAPAGTSWSKTITSGASIGDTLTLHVFKEGYEEFSTSFLYAGTDTTLLVTQTVHPHIASLRTELGITDYTTITEFALDITGTVEIDADDADGNTQKARLAIWYNGILTTENGARYLRGAITILSPAAIRINVDVMDLLVANISATFGLNFTDTDRRLYRSDGSPIYAPASAPGSIQNDYSGVPDTVETGVSGLTGAESAQLMALPSAATVATAVWSKELPL